MVLLALFLYTASGARYDDSDMLSTLDVLNILEALLIMGFFYIVRRDYPDDNDAKYALWFAGIVTGVLILSNILSIWATHLEDSIIYMYDYATEEMIEFRGEFVEKVLKWGYYLGSFFVMYILPLALAFKTISNRRGIYIVMLLVLAAFALGTVEPYSLGSDTYFRFFILQETFLLSAFASLFFVYAEKDNECPAVKEKITATDWLGCCTIFLALIFFLKDWVCLESGEYDTVLLSGGHSMPAVAMGPAFMALAVMSILLRSNAGKLIGGIMMIVWPLVALIVACGQPVGEFGVTFFELGSIDEEFEVFDPELIKIGNIMGYVLLSILSGIIILIGIRKSSTAPVPPVAPPPQQETEVQE